MSNTEKATCRFIVDQLRSRASDPAAVTVLAELLSQIAGLEAPVRRNRRSETVAAAQAGE